MKLTLRDFLWLMLVFAILFRWWVDHRELTRKKVLDELWAPMGGGVTSFTTGVKPPANLGPGFQSTIIRRSE